MTDKEFEELKAFLLEVIDITILKLKAADLLKEKGKTAFEKTEVLLWQYKCLKKSDQPYAKRVVAEIEDSLQDIADEPYAKTINMFYFEGKTNEAIANEMFCDERTARRRRRELVERLSARLASDDFIRELLL